MIGLGGQFLVEYSENAASGYASDTDWWAGATILAFALLLLVLTLGLMLGQRWARAGLIIVFGISLGAWTLVIAVTFRDAAGTWLVTGGLSILVYGLLLFGLLAVSNRYIMGPPRHGPSSEEDWPDLLDR